MLAGLFRIPLLPAESVEDRTRRTSAVAGEAEKTAGEDQEETMNIDDLQAACGDGTGQMTLVIPRKPGRGEGIRMTPSSGPIGYIVCVNSEGHTVARFDCKAVLRWLDKHAPAETAP